jgi:anti-anti-sigma factor
LDRSPKTLRVVVTQSLELQAVVHAEDVTVSLSGELDLASVRTLQDVLGSANRGFGAAILDLSRLSFIDVGGVHAIFEARDACARGGVALWLVPGPRAVQRVFELTGATTSLSWAASDAHALLGQIALAIAGR